MPVIVDMVREFVDEIQCFDDFNSGADCGFCGREDVWLNFLGECRECVGKSMKQEEETNGNGNR